MNYGNNENGMVVADHSFQARAMPHFQEALTTQLTKPNSSELELQNPARFGFFIMVLPRHLAALTFQYRVEFSKLSTLA